VLDGCDATRLLRAEGYQGPIVALTASTDNCDRGRCVRAGCNAFAGKPIERDALLRTIAAFIPQGAAVTAPS
jgi:CheY-like chemotaxis protein